MNFIIIGIVTLLALYGYLLMVSGNTHYTLWKLSSCTEKSAETFNRLLGGSIIVFAIGMLLAFIKFPVSNDPGAWIRICLGAVTMWGAASASITFYFIIPKKRSKGFHQYELDNQRC